MNELKRIHALLSASGSKKWLNCTPSAKLEEEFPDIVSVFAEEGTFMHQLGELQLIYYIQGIDRKGFCKKLEEYKKNKYYNTQIYEAIQTYVDLVVEHINQAKKITPDAAVFIE